MGVVQDLLFPPDKGNLPLGDIVALQLLVFISNAFMFSSNKWGIGHLDRVQGPGAVAR
jgi:hypothetical protein